MPGPLARWMLVLALLAGCGASPAQQSKYSLDRFFSDPKAQALALAAEQGNVEEVRRLMTVEGVDPDGHFSPDGYPLLMWPIFTKSPDGLQAMLENGADPNARQLHPAQDTTRFKGRYKNNAMVWAAEQEDPIYLKLLLDHGGDPNTRNSNGESLLFHAFIKQNQWENVKLLVEHGAEVDARAAAGSSILNIYASRGGFEMAYWLLQHGADPTVTYDYDQLIKRSDSHPIEAIFWHPGNPTNPEWQRKCQQWLLQRGYERPPMPEHYRRMRKNLAFPYEEQDIPLL